jgi:hypothetical protein
MDESLQSVLKDFITTFQGAEYDFDKTIDAFPELSGYGKNVLLDYVSTAEANGYDYEKINPAFQEFGMEADKEGSLEEELTAPPEVETEVKIDVPKEKPLKTLEELNKIRGESDEMSEEEYQSEVSRTIGDIVKRGKALNINATDSDDEDDQFVDTIYDKLAVNSLPKMDQVLQNNVSHVEELKNTPLVTVKEIPDPTYAESTGITKKIYTQVSNEEANKIYEENKVKPTEEQVVIEKLFNGRGPAYYDDRSIEDQTADYNESVKAIKGSNLSEKDKNIKINNLHKPTYSTLKEIDGKMQYAIKPEFQEKVNTYLGDIQKEFINQDMSNPEVSKNYAKRIQEVSSELVTNDPILQNKALSIQNILKPKYEAIRKSIEKKYNLTLDSSESSIEAAEKEYNKLTSELFQSKMSKSPIYQHVVSDINNAIGVSAEETSRFIDKMDNPIYKMAAVAKGFNGFTGIAGTLLEQGYSAIQNQAKSFNSSQISQQQLGLEERTSQINEIKNIQAAHPGKEIYAYPDGTLDYSRMDIGTIGQGDPGGLTEGQKPKQKYSVSGNEWKSSVVNPEEYIANREAKNAKSEEIILSDLEELQKYSEVAELADTIDFEDEDGTTFKDVVGTVGQVLPNIVTGIVGTVAAPATGGLSLLGSSLLIGGQEYGDNYWTALETGLREELGREPSNEEIVDALAEGKYSDQGTAAGWAALSTGLELGTFGSINKALKTTASSMGFKGTKDFVTKVMNGELRNAVKNSKSFLVNGGKGYIKEYFTEAAQELAGQASVGQQLDNDILKRIDLNSAHQAGTGGGIVGAILPSAGSMSRGSFSLIRKASRQAAITLNLKNAENFKQQTKFFQNAQNALKTKLDKKQITPEQYQEEVDAISNLRNSSLKIPKEFSNEARSKALDLMVKQKKLQEKAKEQLDEFSGKDKIALAEVNQELTDLSNSENAINNAIKLTKDAGLDVSIIRKKTTKETQKELRKFKLNNKQSKAASKNFGIHVVDGKDGKRSIVLNEEAINNSKKWTTAQHEVLHDVLSVALEGNDRAVFAMGNAVDNVLKNVDGKSNANFKERLDAYKNKPESIRAEEKITLLSEALTNGEVTFDEGVFTKLGDFVRRVFQQIAPESKLGKIKFDTAEDVYRFIKDYNKSFAKGKLTKAQKNVLDKGIEISEDITPKGPLQKQDISVKESIDESALQEEGLSIQDETGQEIDEEIETSRIDEMDEITKAIPQEVIDKELDKTATEEEVLKQFKPLATFIASQYIGNAKYQANRKALIDSILTDERGILGLYRDYQAKTDQEFDGTAGQFINNQKGGIRQRSKQIAAEVLGYAAPKTGPKKSPIPEGRQEGESLRRTMGFFTTKELDQMLADREINKPQYDKLLKSSQQQVIKKGPNQGKTYGEVIDGFFNKVKNQVQKGVLVSPKQIVDYLTNEFKTKRFVDDVKDLMGTPNSQQYTDFLNNFSEAIYDKLTQRQVNKRFAFAKEPVIDPATGKQKRMTVGESQAIGTQVSDKKAGNPIFKKKAFDENQFKQEHLNPTTGRPASKQTALAESVAEIIGFDASQQALQDPETLANLTDRNKTMAELEVVSNDIANQTARGMTFKFSLDDGSAGSINQEDAPNLQKDLDTFNKLVLDKGFEDGDGNLVPEVAEALEKSSPKLRELINYLYKENPDLNVDAKGFKSEVLEAIKLIDPALYDKIKSKGTVLRSIVKGVKNYNKVVTDRMNAGSQALGKTIDNRVFGALGFDFLGYKNGILDPAGRKKDKQASKEQGKTVYQTDEDGNFIEGMYYNDAQALKDLEYTDDLFVKYVEDLDKLGIKLSDSILMNKDSTKLKNILKPIFETTNLERKKQLLEEARPKIEKANTANKLLFKYIANKLNEAYKKGDVDLEYVFQMLQTQTNISLGFRSLSGFDFMYLQEGNQYVEGKTKPSISRWLEMTDAQRAELLEDFNTVNDFKERYDLHLKNNLEAGKLDLINAQWQAAFGTVSAYKDLTIKGEHLGANANTMAKIFLGIAEGNLTDAMLEEMFVEHTQLFGPTYLMDVIDAKGVEGGAKTGATSKEGIFRLTKFLKNNPKFSKNLYAKSGEKAFIELGNVEKLIEDIEILDKSQNSAKDENVVVFKESKVLDMDDNMSMDDVLNKAKTIDEALKQAKKLNAPVKKIRVFDFDDTLATTESNVIANRGDESITLNAEEFAEQGKSLLDQGYKFDFSEFNKVTKGKEGPLLKIAKKIKDARGNEDLFVLTARAPQSQQAIYEFLKSQGVEFKKENIIGLGKSTGASKANWIIDQAAKGYNDFYFADDAIQNVQAVRDALEVVDVKSKVQQAKLKFSLNVDKDFNDIIEQKSGIASEKEYSEAKAKVRGANKGKFKFWIPPSAEDFMGLIYPLLSKGKLGDNQMAWFKKHLFDPFAKANQALSQARLNLMNDFKALKKDLDVPKELSKESVDGFTNEQAVRVYLWNKQGLDIPGLSKADTKELVNAVENNEKLKIFADKLVQINKRAYPAPAEGWLTGSITSDLIQGLKVKRSELLAEWQANADIIFSNKNLNKLEAIHGAKYREALENVLSRMKAGSNRLQTGNRLSNRILNYINGSNAAIMFFNTRSAILQTISAINFINWDFNNPLKAGKAFANQPQYWKDFMSLMNSDFLRDRRNGLRININESEIADLAKTSKNKAKAVMAYILEKGYLPTQFADSFAIALGGATFYRNKIDALIKDGMSKKEAEEVAMREFREIAEESQQSARPDKISQQQSSDVGRLILMFANTPMQYSRLMKRAFQDLVNGRGSSKSNMSKIVYYAFVQNLIFNALQQALFKLGFEDDEEDEKKRTYRTINGMADSLLRGLGIGGATVSVAKNFLMDIYERSGRSRPEYTDSVWKLLQFSPPIGSKIARLRAAGWAFDSKKRRQEILDKGFSLDNPGLMSAAKVISATTNVPLDRVLLKMENIEGSMNEEADWWQRLAMIGGWSSWDIMKESSSKSKSSRSKKSLNKRKNKRKYNKRK